MNQSWAWRITRVVLLACFATFFALPLLALLNFSTKDTISKERTADAWRALFDNPLMSEAIRTSLELAAITTIGMVVLLVPTMVWVRLRVPAATRLVEFLCLLPLTIPALVIVVGLDDVYAWVNYLVNDSALTLAFVYVVLVLPFSYRAIDAALSAIDSTTLAEAARSLGAGWFTVIVRVIVPNIWQGVLNAAFITVALVLGEFTIASLLHYNTLPVAIVQLGKSDAATSMAASLGTLLLAFVLLVLLSLLDRRRHHIGRTS
ncbi:MAG TPA: ABC transporter permease subunit [Nocardioides sp.]|uniref:ABC transporter permease n=1 Tax=Nocardioides sp. TaxID=35761 RepID=UPI002E325126|nr:ABC transporter permease subunit [Nocardioides sp.]HEX5089819.1 ABC transporter permease subunit [Nocardioides sp.]